MAHEVFICYSSQDKAVADSVCAMLEGIGLRCWIAPRDVPAGKWGGAIMEAVAQSRLMILIFSANSNNSANCLSEVHAAFSKRDTIIPMRIDNTIPSGDMEYYLQTYHWLDARTPPFEMHLQGLADRVKTDLAHAAAREEAAARAKKEAEEAKKAQEAARAKKEAEEATKEKARQEATTARARQEAEVAAKEKARREAETARIKKEAEEASKEKARWEEEATRARQEAGEAKKAREAALKAKKEAEESRKERARQEAETAKVRREAEKARKTPEKRKAGKGRVIWLSAGVVLSLAGIVVAWGFALIWSGFFGFPVEEEPWYLLFSFTLLFGLPGVVPGILFIRRGITGYLQNKLNSGKASRWWWFLPVALGFIGGIISWLANKNVNWRQARNMLTAGVLLSLMFTIIPLLPGENVVDILSFKDDFEDGNAYGWNLQPGWRVGTDNGSHVLEGQAQDYQWAWPLVTQAPNWVLEADFKLINGSLRFNTLYSQGAVSPNRYLVEITEGGLSLSKEYSENNARNFIPLDKSQADIVLNKGYHIAISVGGNSIRVYLNDELKIDGWDSNPLNSGNFAIEIGKNSHAYVDNIAVKPYLDRRSVTTPAPAPTPTPTPPLSATPIPSPKPGNTSSTQELDKYIQINFDTVAFNYNEISGRILFTATVNGTLKCTKDLPLPLKQASLTAKITASLAGKGTEVTLNPEWTIAIKPFPAKQGETATITEVVWLQFPAEAEAGNYNIRAKIASASASADGVSWYDVTSYLPPEQDIGWVTHTAEQTQFYYVSGYVRESGTNAPITGAKVEVLNSTNSIVGFSTTDSNGYYKTTPMSTSGTYILRATLSGYVTVYYSNVTDQNKATQLTINAADGIQKIDFTMTKASSISGTVRNADGSTTLSGILVECWLWVNGAQTSRFSTTTDSQGNYIISGIPYGDYVVRARGNNYDFGLEYYPEKARSMSAQLVKVASGVNPADINFTLEAGGTISGRVVSDADSKPIANVRIFVWDYNTGEWFSSADTKNDGTYTVHGLRTGSYRVGTNIPFNNLPYVDEYYYDTTISIAARGVTVTAGKDTPNINFSLAPK